MTEQRTRPADRGSSLRRGMLQALGFFAFVEVIGLAAAPLAALAFGRLPGAGLGFAKPLGVLLVAWAVWMAASIGPVRYGTATVVVVVAAVALLVAYSPDVWGTERPMDMAFVNAINASSSFPPHDPWMSGEDL